jgi:carbamoyltransferase
VRVLGVNAVFHDPSAALVVDGRIVAAAEEERFSRRKHGKRPVPWSAWELPEQAMRWCLESADLRPDELDAVGYSYDPTLCEPAEALGIMDPWDHVRTEYARGAPTFLAAALPGLDPDRVRFVPIMSPTPHPLGWPRRTCAAPAWFSTPWRMRVAPERPVRRPRPWASTSRTVRP